MLGSSMSKSSQILYNKRFHSKLDIYVVNTYEIQKKKTKTKTQYETYTTHLLQNNNNNGHANSK